MVRVGVYTDARIIEDPSQLVVAIEREIATPLTA
jgi:hypothetical protein